MDPESVNQIVKAITSLHDGRTWKPETIVSAVAALAATGAAIFTLIQGKRQIVAAKEVAKLQIEAAQAAAQRQIDSAQTVAHQQLIMPMREAWIGQLRTKIAWYLATCLGLFFRASSTPIKDRRGLLLVRLEIKLMLNVEESDHDALDSALFDLANVSVAEERDNAKFERIRAGAIRLSHAILRSEWQRAKADE